MPWEEFRSICSQRWIWLVKRRVAGMKIPRAVERKTYDIFAGYWPRKDDDFANGIAGKFNRVKKYVAAAGIPRTGDMDQDTRER